MSCCTDEAKLMLAVLTNSSDATADYLLQKLDDAGMTYFRVDTDRVTGEFEFEYRDGVSLIRTSNASVRPSEIKTVWYRRPERLVSDALPTSPEAEWVLDEWSENLECFFSHIPLGRWMNHPTRNSLASRKLEQLTIARSLGIDVPLTIVTQSEVVAREFVYRHGGSVVVKPLSRGYIDRVDTPGSSLIYTTSLKGHDLDDLQDVRRCPTLFQQEIEKVYDVRVTYVDGEFHAVKLVATEYDGRQRCDIRRNNMADVKYELIDLPKPLLGKLRELIRGYGLRFAAVDLAFEKNGRWYFFEINPNGQWAWLDLVGATSIYNSFVKAFVRQ